VLLFDEIEKAHPDVFNVLLQVLDDGRVTDSQGRTVNFKNTVVIMTSNIGAPRLLEGVTDQGTILSGVRDDVMRQLRASFRPEFLNRVDDIVLFKPLRLTELRSIVDLHCRALAKRLAARRITLELSDDARDFLARESYDPAYGARPLRRTLQRELETQLARALIAGSISDGAAVRVTEGDGALAIEFSNQPEAANA
jgi:ATP-dependent Clp protease ATP-binding subunit ClpB